MPNGLLQTIWKFLSPKFQGADGLLNKAMETAKQNSSPAAVMGFLDGVARQRGWGDILSKNQIWQSLKTKRPDEIIPHAQNVLKETGHLNTILNFFNSPNKK